MLTKSSQPPRFALFSYGFRPFFLLGATFAALALPVWLSVFLGAGTTSAAPQLHWWHAHEMVFGFVVAVVAGFMLTAVPNWSGGNGFSGRPLVILAVLWLMGRVAFVFADELPALALAATELAFLPGLILVLAPPLLRAKNRNVVLLIVLALLWLADLAFVLALARREMSWAVAGIHFAINLALLLVTIIGGRVVPTFTVNAVRRRGKNVTVRHSPRFEIFLVMAMIAVAVVDLLLPGSAAAGWLALLVACAHAYRLSGWNSMHTLGDPLLWVLHIGYAWLPLGFALKALSLLTGVSWAGQWLHALTMGALGTMILAMTSRVALGHTGRPLAAGRRTALAYLLLVFGVLVRVIAVGVWPQHYVGLLIAAGTLWGAAFTLYLLVYTPVLLFPRVDGKPG